MRTKGWKKLSGMLAAAMFAGAVGAMPVQAAVENGWEVTDGNWYWYENGVKQGTEGRGKEIYDPDSDAWYWLDAVDGGKKATGKDLYQESDAGEWAEKEDGTGKWVRYDDEGHMVKGWYSNENGTYYFDQTYGTMAKGDVEIDGVPCCFDEITGIAINNEWVTLDGIEYWYENGIRQGLEGRGKEIFDPGTNAWYWLDSVDNGKMAAGKDVYQESEAGQWAANADGTGKWVRYDENGHMIKGWYTSENGTYYFDQTYGTMAKGTVTIDGITYEFDKTTGILVENTEVSDENNSGQRSMAEEWFFSWLERDNKEVEQDPQNIPYFISRRGEGWMVNVFAYCDINNNPKYVSLYLDDWDEEFRVYTTYETYLKWAEGYKVWLLENEYNYNASFVFAVLNPTIWDANGNVIPGRKYPGYWWRFETEE